MPQLKILIVDDEPFNVDYLEQELEDSGCTLFSASDGQAALRAVAAQSPDLVLLDVMMPVMDGFAVLAHLKADPATRHIPVIIISADSDLGSVVRGIQLGAEDYLPKPFQPALLHARISSSLERKRLRDLEQLYLNSLQREMDIAREIQKSFLPAGLPALPGWQIAASLTAAREVAGDFYDAFLLPSGELLCAIGDVCDKGVGAALFMTLFRSLVRVTATSDLGHSLAGNSALSPTARLRHVLSYTNEYIADTHADANMFATLFVAILNPHSGLLSYINAGNEPPLLVRADGTLVSLPPGGPTVGVIPGAAFRTGEITLAAGDLLLAFTDGLPDALDDQGHSFGRERVQQLLRPQPASPAGLLQQITSQAAQFSGSAAQFDDITLLAVRRD